MLLRKPYYLAPQLQQTQELSRLVSQYFHAILPKTGSMAGLDAHCNLRCGIDFQPPAVCPMRAPIQYASMSRLTATSEIIAAGNSDVRLGAEIAMSLMQPYIVLTAR
ncbi:hypothetical protein CO675_11500 [Bradyrhizobium sp. C9]|nr:hypothetical protein CO675_11500 [Bradyrhizobium sp. C9]